MIEEKKSRNKKIKLKYTKFNTENDMLRKFGIACYSKQSEFKKLMKDINDDKIYEKYKEDFPELVSYSSGIFTLKCDTCKELYDIPNGLFHLRVRNNALICINCHPISRFYSGKEKQVIDYIKSIYDGPVLENNRQVLASRREIDAYLPELKLGFEFDGTYWHADPRFYKETDTVANKLARDIWQRDLEKDLMCEEAGIKLIRIKEFDWLEDVDAQKTIIKNSIKNYLHF